MTFVFFFINSGRTEENQLKCVGGPGRYIVTGRERYMGVRAGLSKSLSGWQTWSLEPEGGNRWIRGSGVPEPTCSGSQGGMFTCQEFCALSMSRW